MKPMTEEHLAILRRHMVEVIALHFDLASEEIGKDKLDARVAAAMLRVPRHLSYRRLSPPWPITTPRCRSASTRPCRSRSSAR